MQQVGIITYADWWKEGPSDGGPGGSEDYLTINYYGFWNPKPGPGWNDYGGTGHGYLVEYSEGIIPEPCALAIWSLLGALGITVGWWRQRRRAG